MPKRCIRPGGRPPSLSLRGGPRVRGLSFHFDPGWFLVRTLSAPSRWSRTMELGRCGSSRSDPGTFPTSGCDEVETLSGPLGPCVHPPPRAQQEAPGRSQYHFKPTSSPCLFPHALCSALFPHRIGRDEGVCSGSASQRAHLVFADRTGYRYPSALPKTAEVRKLPNPRTK